MYFFFQYSASELSSLTTALHFIILARWANLSVELVSLRAPICGLRVQIISVFEFPPRESLRRWVNLLSLKLMKFVSLDFFEDSDSAYMTFPRLLRLLLILQSSLRRYPSALVSFTRSLPARSTIWNRDVFKDYVPSRYVVFFWIMAVNTAWDLELSKFMLVLAMCLFSCPLWIKSMTSFLFLTCLSTQFSKKVWPLSSLI